MKPNMSGSLIVILLLIGFFAGVLSGFIGIGGGVVMVPALVFVLGMGQHQAQGLSITTMLPPIGILAFYSYYQNGVVTKEFVYMGLIMAIAFVFGGLVGSKISLKLSPHVVRIAFGIIMLYVAVKMIWSGWSHFNGRS